MKIYSSLLLTLVCALPSGTWAQWQWLDKEGQKVFSDRAPPLDIPEKSILTKPSGKRSPPPAAPPAPSAPTLAASAVRAPAAKDKELEERKAQTEAAEAAKKKAEEAQSNKLRAENCTRARSAKNMFESGKPLRHTNAQGESVFMDETTRAAEARHTQEIMNKDCAR